MNTYTYLQSRILLILISLPLVSSTSFTMQSSSWINSTTVANSLSNLYEKSKKALIKNPYISTGVGIAGIATAGTLLYKKYYGNKNTLANLDNLNDLALNSQKDGIFVHNETKPIEIPLTVKPLNEPTIAPVTTQPATNPTSLTLDHTKPLGLQNGTNGLKNRCFINAVIQCMYSLNDVSDLLLQQKDIYSQNTLAQSYLELVKNLRDTNQSQSLDPVEFCKIGWQSMNSPVNMQHDSAELLQILMDSVINPQPSCINQELKELCSATIITSFAGINLEQEDETILSLHISPESKTLQQCMQSFFGMELLDDDAYGKLTQLEKAGKYIILNLKRNLYNAEKKSYTKNESAITFPLTNFDLTPYAQKNMPNYELVGLIMHSGNAGGGHYTAYVKKNSHWYFCDDSIVQEVDSAQITTIAQRGYGTNGYHVPIVFFYQKS